MSRTTVVLAILGACGPITNDPPLPELDTGTAGTTSETGVGYVPEPPSCAELPDEAEQVLGTRCAACHGPGSPAYGEFGDALDAIALISGGWVTPADPANSRIMIEINADTMPPASGGGALSDPEKAVIEGWIACGAADWGTVESTRGFLSPEMEYQAASNDAAVLDRVESSDPDQPNARYLTLIPLYNSGVSTEQIELFGTALTKLMWNLTTERGVPVLAPIDLDGLALDDGTVVRVADDLGDKLLFRVDLDEFAWDNAGEAVDVWEELVKAYPFGIRYDDELEPARDLVADTRTRVPIVHGDWFAGNASLPPLYFDVLDIPDTLDGFLAEFGAIPDFGANFANNQVDCAGFDGSLSLVSDQNRVTCRHYAIPSYCWQTFDFDSVAGDNNIFTNPAGFLQASDGGEAFCSLFSGQQVYLAFDALGDRVDNASTDLVTDFNPDSGAVVKTGLHCMRCHDNGLLTVTDQVLGSVTANEELFTEEVILQVEDLYPELSDWEYLQDLDIAEFQSSLDTIGVDALEEPIWALSLDYEAGLSAARVAADLGLAEGAFLDRLATNGDLQLLYAPLYTGELLSRDVFELAARDTICEIEAGDECDFEAFCGLSSVPCVEGSVCDHLGQCSRIVD